jgi:hypothetical protein
MGAVLPENPSEQLAFFLAHAPIWLERTETIGLSEETAVKVAELTEDAREKYAAALKARQAALDATRAWRDALKELKTVGSAAIGTIKSYAQITGDATVYARGGVDKPEKSGPKRRVVSEDGDASSAVPSLRSVQARPDARGTIELTWTARKTSVDAQGRPFAGRTGAGAGMFYRIERSVDGSPWSIIDVAGGPGAGKRSNRFVDDRVPADARVVRYMITPRRGQLYGQVGNIATVQLGGSEGPEMSIGARGDGRRVAA